MEFRKKRIEIQNLEKLKNPQKYWNIFYTRNGNRFFKDRHWFIDEFKDLLIYKENDNCNLLEAGCGVGNTLFPLLELFPKWKFYGFDFSSKAIEIIKENPNYNKNKMCVFEFDMTNLNISKYIHENSIDIVMLIFVLSAIPPDNMLLAISNLSKIMKTGSTLLFRDYAEGDNAQIRFHDDNKIEDNQFVRADGTQSYFFKINEISQLFEKCGLKEIKCEYIYKKTTNIKDNLILDRKFIQAIFLKK